MNVTSRVAKKVTWPVFRLQGCTPVTFEELQRTGRITTPEIFGLMQFAEKHLPGVSIDSAAVYLLLMGPCDAALKVMSKTLEVLFPTYESIWEKWSSDFKVKKARFELQGKEFPINVLLGDCVWVFQPSSLDDNVQKLIQLSRGEARYYPTWYDRSANGAPATPEVWSFVQLRDSISILAAGDLGIRHAWYLFTHQDEGIIPNSWRKKENILFPGTVMNWTVPSEERCGQRCGQGDITYVDVPCLHWDSRLGWWQFVWTTVKDEENGVISEWLVGKEDAYFVVKI